MSIYCTEDEFNEVLACTKKYSPESTPLGWKILPPFPQDSPLYGMNVYQRIGDRLAVILTASKWPGDVEVDRVWLHVSLSRPHSLPSYEDMATVKKLFIGADKRAYQIFAEESQHVNIHSYCLHLWCVVEGKDDFPNFGEDGTI